MGRLCEVAVVSFLVVFLLSTESTWAKRGSGSSSSGKKTSSSSNRGGTQSKPSSQPGSYPRQPQSPNRNPNPYPAGGTYPHPGGGNTNPGGVPRQNPGSYPGAGGYPNQNPGRGNPGGYPHQNPAGGYPHQNPAGGYPAGGGYPVAGGYPAGGGYPNQNPARNYPGAGGYPAGGGYPNQNPGRNYPNQYPAAGGYPAGGGYGAGGYPAGGGGYPVRGGNTGWGAPAGNPGGYPGGYPAGSPNWNPNNKILSPRFGGGSYGQGGYGQGGSPFSHSVQNMGYKPQSTGFAKKAMMAAGVGAVAGMAVGYGLGRFPRPHFNFRNPEEENSYNNYMYRSYGSRSTDQKDYGRDYVYQPPPGAQTYENFMSTCMNRTDLLKEQSRSSTTTQIGSNEDNDTVSIEEIGYPALIEQVRSKRCVEKYMEYSQQFLVQRKAEEQHNRGDPLSYGVIQIGTSLFVLLSSMILLQ